MAAITVNIKTIDGATFNVTNREGWDQFLAGMYGMRAVVSDRFFIPLDKIIHITPANPVMLSSQDPNLANVVHLTPNNMPPPLQPPAPQPETPPDAPNAA